MSYKNLPAKVRVRAMIAAEHAVRDALGARVNESINDAAIRVYLSASTWGHDPSTIAVARRVVLAMDEDTEGRGWPSVFRAARLARRLEVAS